jgi:RNA polymerase sigma-70 factor, ECF subfamily
VIFQAFDAEYLRQLREGDPRVESHFAAYFGELIHLKLRRRVRNAQLLEDIRQETLCRVLCAVRKEGGVEDPKKFGAFVSGVCHWVTVEHYRTEGRFEQAEGESEQPADPKQDPDVPLINEQRKRQVRDVLSRLDSRDRRILRSLFLEETGTAEVCRQIGVEPDYLRVLVFRAKARFRQAYAQAAAAGG